MWKSKLFQGSNPSRALKIPDRAIGHDGVAKNRADKTRSIGNRIAKVSAGQIRGLKVHLGKVGIRQDGLKKIITAAVGFQKIGVPEIDLFGNTRRKNYVAHIGPV